MDGIGMVIGLLRAPSVLIKLSFLLPCAATAITPVGGEIIAAVLVTVNLMGYP